MSERRFSLSKRARWVDRHGVVHLCFKWDIDLTNHTYWSTVCSAGDSNNTFSIRAFSVNAFNDDTNTRYATCVRCIAATMEL